MRKCFILGSILLLILTGCQDRKVNRLIDIQEDTTLEISTTVVDAETTEELTISAIPNEKIETTQTEVPNTQAAATTTEAEPIIVAKSEDLNDQNATTIILNEIDALLDETLNSLDKMENDTITDAYIEEGGLN